MYIMFIIYIIHPFLSIYFSENSKLLQNIIFKHSTAFHKKTNRPGQLAAIFFKWRLSDFNNLYSPHTSITQNYHLLIFIYSRYFIIAFICKIFYFRAHVYIKNIFNLSNHFISRIFYNYILLSDK